MAEHRTVQTKMWRDQWFSELPPDGKLLWVYLFSNPSAALCGLYQLPIKFIALDIGIFPERVTALLQQFDLDGKIEWASPYIWIKNLLRYQTFDGKASPQVRARIDKDLADIPDGLPIKNHYLSLPCSCERCQEPDPSSDENTVSEPTDTPSIPYRYPTGRVSIPYRETDTYTDKDTETDVPPSGGENAPPAKTPRQIENELRQHPALLAFRSARAHRWPPKEHWRTIIETVGADPPRVELWQQCLIAYSARGYNRDSIDGPLDWFRAGAIPPRNGGAGARASPNAVDADKTEAVLNAMRREARKRYGPGERERAGPDPPDN